MTELTEMPYSPRVGFEESDERMMRFDDILRADDNAIGSRLPLVHLQPLIDAEAIDRTDPWNYEHMLQELAGRGHAPAFNQWLTYVYGDLTSHTPEDANRNYPRFVDDPHYGYQQLYRMLNDAGAVVSGYHGHQPDMSRLVKIVDSVEEYCRGDMSHEVSREVLRTLSTCFDNTYTDSLGLTERCQALYREALTTFLRVRIPVIEGGLVANRAERNTLRTLVDIGWHEPDFRAEVDALITELRAHGTLSDADEAKLANWRAPILRKIKYKGTFSFRWENSDTALPL